MPADADAVKAELARLGACPLCVLRFHGTRCASERDAYVAAAASTSRDDAPCPCCLGVLQLSLDVSSSRARSGEGACTSGDGGGDGDDAAAASGGSGKPKQTHVERVDVSSVMQYVDGMRAGGHEMNAFALEVTLPPALAVRQAATRAHLAEVFASAADADASAAELPKAEDVKDVFRALVIPLLENFGGKDGRARLKHSNDASFRFSLLFEHEASATEASFAPVDGGGRGGGGGGSGGGGGRHHHHDRKRKLPPAHLNVPTMPDAPAARWSAHGNAYNYAERVASSSPSYATSSACRAAGVAVPPSPPRRKTTCRMLTYHAPVYVGGRYLKWARGVPQSPWVADGETVGEGSVQTSLEAVVVRRLRADGAKLNAAGREDMDVRMLGGGRPFILEVHNPRRIAPSTAECAEMERELEANGDGVVTASGLHLSDHERYRAMHEGSAEKEKTYSAVCYVARALTDADVAKLCGVKDLVVRQSTPTRVLHRRSAAVRERTIASMSAEAVPGSPRFFTLRMTTQAGTYVKEFVHGDFGRTSPNVGTLLGCPCDILQLDVTDVDMAFAGGGGSGGGGGGTTDE